MSDLAERLAKLSPEKRRLLELLEQRKTTKPAAEDPALIQEDHYFSLEPGHYPAKDDVIRLYDAITDQLNASPFGEFSVFLNWGYVANDNPQFARIKLPDITINKNPIRLVLEVIGDCPLRAKDAVLDVACGRGGTVSVFRKFFCVARITGVDLSPKAIAFCRRIHTYPDTEFIEGDSQNLPLDDASYNIVTNLESSHCYPDIGAFYREVYRVLKPGGYFLYTDVLPAVRLNECLGALHAAGFQQQRRQDITSNVLLSCDDIADHHARVFRQDNNRSVMNNFLAMRNSPVYNHLRSGNYKYLLFRFRKPTA